MTHLLGKLLWNNEGQDIAEYAVMLAVILVSVVGTIRLVRSNANVCFRPRLAQFNDPAAHARGGPA
jgi:Flp pilus assembly pilin Flp